LEQIQHTTEDGVAMHWVLLGIVDREQSRLEGRVWRNATAQQIQCCVLIGRAVELARVDFQCKCLAYRLLGHHQGTESHQRSARLQHRNDRQAICSLCASNLRIGNVESVARIERLACSVAFRVVGFGDTYRLQANGGIDLRGGIQVLGLLQRQVQLEPALLEVGIVAHGNSNDRAQLLSVFVSSAQTKWCQMSFTSRARIVVANVVVPCKRVVFNKRHKQARQFVLDTEANCKLMHLGRGIKVRQQCRQYARTRIREELCYTSEPVEPSSLMLKHFVALLVLQEQSKLCCFISYHLTNSALQSINQTNKQTNSTAIERIGGETVVSQAALLLHQVDGETVASLTYRTQLHSLL
jgi:hypothetical protein